MEVLEKRKPTATNVMNTFEDGKGSDEQQWILCGVIDYVKEAE